MAKGLIIFGLGLALLGVALLFFPKLFAWFGHLPGDIRTQTVFFPATSMLVVSGVLTLFVNLLGWLLRSR